MKEINKIRTEALKNLKKSVQMKPLKKTKFDLNIYSIISKGEFLRNSYTWKLTDFELETYFLFINNSYKEKTSYGGEGSPTIIDTIRTKHSSVIIKPNFNIPELIIRPSKMRDKILDLFLRFDLKLKGRNKFNRRYILESKCKVSYLGKILTSNITDELNKYKGLNIEFKDNTILVIFEKEFNLKESLELIEITKTLVSEINVAQQCIKAITADSTSSESTRNC